MRIPNLLKWAGGKTGLINQIMDSIPKDFLTYYEPFVGGGALFWNLKAMGKIRDAVISDVNPSLINFLRIVKEKPYDLDEELDNFRNLNGNIAYLEVRRKFNRECKKIINDVENAAMFVYLNKTCFNGLWRTNSRGEFNVPYGGYSVYHLPNEGEIIYYSLLLENTKILLSDYKEVISFVKAGDFVYLDPPYARNKKSNFIQYNQFPFTENNLDELEKAVSKLTSRGVKVILSNSLSENVLRKFSGYSKIIVNSHYSINSNGNGRGNKKEILIRNF
ncbi:DNA adenine methylase [Caldiplasma sukawensis]